MLMGKQSMRGDACLHPARIPVRNKVKSTLADPAALTQYVKRAIGELEKRWTEMGKETLAVDEDYFGVLKKEEHQGMFGGLEQRIAAAIEGSEKGTIYFSDPGFCGSSMISTSRLASIHGQSRMER